MNKIHTKRTGSDDSALPIAPKGWVPVTAIGRLFKKYLLSFDHPSKVRIENWIGRSIFKEGILLECEGVKLQLDANDWITRIMIEEGRFEGLSLDRARKIMEGGGNFVDVGANFGLYTCTVGNIPGVKCLAVDASAEMMKVFQKNVSLNPSVKAEEALTALGSEYGKVKFFCPNKGNKGTSKTVLMDEGVSGDYIVLDCVPLEALLAERKIKPIRLLKIDIEGFEMEVFKVFDFSGQYRPSNIIMEFIPRLHSDSISLGSCRAFFEERRYELLNVSGVPIRSEADVQEDNIWLRSL